MKIETQLTGFKELDKLLKQMPEKVEKKVLQKAVNSAMREGVNALKSAAPQDLDGQSEASKKYGRLKKNIRMTRLKKVKKGQKGVRVHTGNAFWALFYELGTRFQPARPWFLPAFKSASDRILNRLGDALSAGIEKEFKK